MCAQLHTQEQRCRAANPSSLSKFHDFVCKIELSRLLAPCGSHGRGWSVSCSSRQRPTACQHMQACEGGGCSDVGSLRNMVPCSRAVAKCGARTAVHVTENMMKLKFHDFVHKTDDSECWGHWEYSGTQLHCADYRGGLSGDCALGRASVNDDSDTQYVRNTRLMASSMNRFVSSHRARRWWS